LHRFDDGSRTLEVFNWTFLVITLILGLQIYDNITNLETMTNDIVQISSAFYLSLMLQFSHWKTYNVKLV
jgi:hypothetical protein